MPKNSNFRLPRDHRFFAKIMEVMVMAPNHSGDPLGSILGPMGSHLLQNMGQNRKNLPCAEIRIFDYLAVIDFSQEMEVAVMAPNHGRDPLGSILGPMGSHWVPKMGQNRKNYHAPKFEFLATPRSGPPRVHLGANAFPLFPKNCSNCKKLQCPKIRIFDYPRSSIFCKKWKLRLWR